MTENVPAPIVVCADDFGLHSSVNRAIFRAHVHGVLTHASLVAYGPAFEEAVEIAGDLPSLAVGVHLTLPGNLSGRGQAGLLGECLYHSVRRPRLAGIWRQQIDRVLERGIRPSHLDSHQHTHFFPGIFPLVVRLAEEFGITRIRWLEFPSPTFDQRAIGVLALKFFQRCSLMLHGKVGSNVQLTPAVGFTVSGSLNTKNMLALVDTVARRHPGRSVEIFCHPGDDNIALQRDFGWGYDWESELAALCDPGVKSRIERHNRQSSGSTRLTRAG